jgi:hypothetical protein
LCASILTELQLTVLSNNARTNDNVGAAAVLLRAVARLTELRSLTLLLSLNGYPMPQQPKKTVASVTNMLALRSLRHLRVLNLRHWNVWETNDRVLLKLLRAMPDLATLWVGGPGWLSAGVLPAVGVLCPILEDLELKAKLDIVSFAGYAQQAPLLPNLARLRVAEIPDPPPAVVDAVQQYVT